LNWQGAQNIVPEASEKELPMSVADQPNRQQATLWNTDSGHTWVEMNAVLDRMLAPFEAKLTADAFPGPGRRVLDIGCGAGATTLAMARRLGPEGHALGVDISEPLVAAARARAAAENLPASFVCADAQTHPFEPGAVDAAISRFGVMFFDDPVAAFANIRGALVSGGRLSFIAWRSPLENPFMLSAAAALAPLLPPQPPPEPAAPGQFAFADGERVRGILAASGWSGAAVSPLDLPGEVSEADLMAFAGRLGPAGRALQDADAATKVKAVEALKAAYAPYVTDGVARFATACWWVTATA
jgi:SAM-dependent methyltransferase